MTNNRPDQEPEKLNPPSQSTARDPDRVRKTIERAQDMIDKNTAAIDSAHRALDDLNESEERRRRNDEAGKDSRADKESDD